ncbi:MAG: hypothetical protein ACOC1P_05150 [Minisyncoccales bacterium]
MIKLSTEIISTIALIINAIVLLLVVYQSYLSNKTLEAAYKDIEEEQKEREILFLPKLEILLEVRMQLRKWERDLRKKREEIEGAIKIQKDPILRELAENSPEKPSDLKLSKERYESMPGWLREMWISGAKYYFEAVEDLNHTYDSTANFHEAKDWKNGQSKKSIEALQTLLKYTKDMIPPVILHTPSGFKDEEFFKE